MPSKKETKKEIEKPKWKNFSRAFFQDLKMIENWKLKSVYFFLLSGIVMVWAQLSVHQKSLNLSDRDISSFVSTSSILTMFIPFLSGVIADKLGTFKNLTAMLMILMGFTAFVFIFIPEINVISETCLKPRPKALENGASHLADPGVNEWKLNQSSSRAQNGRLYIYNTMVDQTTNVDLSSSIFQDSVSIQLLPSQKIGNQSETTNCSTERSLRDSSYKVTYWSYLVTRTTFMVLTASSFTLFEGTVMSLEKSCNGVDYGMQRSWGTLAAIFSAYLGGFLVDVYSRGKTTKDFTLMFIGSGMSCLAAGLCATTLNTGPKPPAFNLSTSLMKHLMKIELIALLIVVFLKGVFMGYAETFMYLFMASLGSSSSIIGLTVTVGGALEVVLQVLATPITRALGKVTVISVGLLFYAVRFIAFSFATDPRTILALEAADAWASGLTATVINSYSATFASSDLVTTFRGLVGVLHDGFGKFFISKVGIEIKENLGERIAWRVMSAWAFVSSVAYALSAVIYFGYKKLNKSKSSYDVQSGKDKPQISCHEILSL